MYIHLQKTKLQRGQNTMKSAFVTAGVFFAVTVFSWFPGATSSLGLEGLLKNTGWIPGKSFVSQAVLTGNSSRDVKIPADTADEHNISGRGMMPWIGPKLVVIDPGHGGTDSGASREMLLEKDICRD
jgi:N-acetylmuramoyl-L-alanine amidase